MVTIETSKVSGELPNISWVMVPGAIAQEPTPTEETSILEEQPTPSLINHSAQNILYMGLFLLCLSIIAAIGLVSRKVVLTVILALLVTLAIAALLFPF